MIWNWTLNMIYKRRFSAMYTKKNLLEAYQPLNRSTYPWFLTTEMYAKILWNRPFRKQCTTIASTTPSWITLAKVSYDTNYHWEKIQKKLQTCSGLGTQNLQRQWGLWRKIKSKGQWWLSHWKCLIWCWHGRVSGNSIQPWCQGRLPNATTIACTLARF